MKKILLTIIILFVLAIGSYAAYVFVANNSLPEAVKQWNKFIPEIRALVKKQYPNSDVEKYSQISIYKTADVNGDGLDEALVNLGSLDRVKSAITQVVLFRLKNNQPVIADFKEREGEKRSSPIFQIYDRGPESSITSDIEMLTEKKALFSGGSNVGICVGHAYFWNSQTETFEYNMDMSNELTQKYCAELGKTATIIKNEKITNISVSLSRFDTSIGSSDKVFYPLITNDSNKSIKAISFNVDFYDSEGKLIKSGVNIGARPNNYPNSTFPPHQKIEGEGYDLWNLRDPNVSIRKTITQARNFKIESVSFADGEKIFNTE